MAYYSGPNGQLLINGQIAGQVRSWAFSTTVASLDTTSLGDTDSTLVPGLRSTSGTCSVFYHQTLPGSGGSASTLLTNIIHERLVGDTPGVAPHTVPITLRLKIADGSIGGRYVEGEVLITQASMSMSQSEVTAANIGFSFNGAPTGVVL